MRFKTRADFAGYDSGGWHTRESVSSQAVAEQVAASYHSAWYVLTEPRRVRAQTLSGPCHYDRYTVKSGQRCVGSIDVEVAEACADGCGRTATIVRGDFEPGDLTYLCAACNEAYPAEV